MTVTNENLNPVHFTANRITYYIWDISSVDLQVTDGVLSRVAEWNSDPGCTSNRYQNSRITASAVITSGDVSFTATNILPIIADNVRPR